jgi:hypothetical protein
VAPGALTRAVLQFRSIGRSRFRQASSGVLLPSGVGETSWHSIGPVGIDKYWGIVSGRVAPPHRRQRVRRLFDRRLPGEGKTYLGTAQADSSGNWSLTAPAVPIASGQTLTATATTPRSSSAPPETSEFAANVPAGRLVVTTAADTSSCTPTTYSLRCAIADANSDGSGDTISFNIPASDPGCAPTSVQGQTLPVCTIAQQSGLPRLSASNTLIDGYTQPGARANTNPIGHGDNAVIAIRLDGGACSCGLSMAGTDEIVRGLAILNFNYGILIGARGKTANTVSGDFIGTDGINAAGGTVGIYIASGASGNIVGGTTPATANLVSGSQDGILIGAGRGNVVEGNYVGTDVTGTAAVHNAKTANAVRSENGSLSMPVTAAGLPNGAGVVVFAGASSTTIGGTTGRGNIIAYNGTGVASTASSGTVITGNTLRSNHDGIVVYGGETGDRATLNTITGSADAGVAVGNSGNDSAHAVISQNSISGSGGLGIDLAPIGVVTCSGSNGSPNDGTPCPAIGSAATSRVSGSACARCKVEVFAAAPNGLGHGDGQTYLGSATAGTTGAWVLSGIPLRSGQRVTATATRPSPAESSEYATNVTVH